MKVNKTRQFGSYRQDRWTRVKVVYRTRTGRCNAVEHFAPVARAVEAFLRDNLAYFIGLSCQVVRVEASQVEVFDGRRLRGFDPARHWGPGSFEFAADFPEGTRDTDLLLALWNASGDAAAETARQAA